MRDVSDHLVITDKRAHDLCKKLKAAWKRKLAVSDRIRWQAEGKKKVAEKAFQQGAPYGRVRVAEEPPDRKAPWE